MCTLLKVLSQVVLAIKMAFQAESIALIVMLFEKKEFAWTSWSSGIPLCACDIYVRLCISGNMHCIGEVFDLTDDSHCMKLFLIFINTV